jgi:hypothetical protein
MAVIRARSKPILHSDSRSTGARANIAVWHNSLHAVALRRVWPGFLPSIVLQDAGLNRTC